MKTLLKFDGKIRMCHWIEEAEEGVFVMRKEDLLKQGLPKCVTVLCTDIVHHIKVPHQVSIQL